MTTLTKKELANLELNRILKSAQASIKNFQEEVAKNPTDAIKWNADEVVKAGVTVRYMTRALEIVEENDDFEPQLLSLKNNAFESAVRASRSGYNSTNPYSNANDQNQTTALFDISEALDSLLGYVENIK